MKSGTARFSVSIAIEALIVLAVLFLAFFLSGCAARQAHAQTPHFWRDCEIDDRYPVSVKPGDPKHFICTENDNGEKWEVAVNPKQ